MKKIFPVVFLFLFLTLTSVRAAGLVPCGGETEPACQFCHFFVLINNILENVLFKFFPAVAVLMLIVGGIMFMLGYFGGAEILPGGGKGGPRVLNLARRTILSVVVGVVIILSAWIIINTILTKIGVVQSGGLLQWYEISCPVQ